MLSALPLCRSRSLITKHKIHNFPQFFKYYPKIKMKKITSILVFILSITLVQTQQTQAQTATGQTSTVPSIPGDPEKKVTVAIADLNQKLKKAAMRKVPGAELIDATNNVTAGSYDIGWKKGKIGGRLTFNEIREGKYEFVRNGTEVAEKEIPMIIPANVTNLLTSIIPKAKALVWISREFADGRMEYETYFTLDEKAFFFKYDVLRKERNIIITSKTGSIVEYLDDAAFTNLLNLPSPNSVNTATDKINNYIKNQNYEVNRTLFAITAQLPERRSSKVNSVRQGRLDMEITADLVVKDTEKGKRLLFGYQQSNPDKISEKAIVVVATK